MCVGGSGKSDRNKTSKENKKLGSKPRLEVLQAEDGVYMSDVCARQSNQPTQTGNI